MKRAGISWLVPLSVALSGIASIFVWLKATATASVTLRLPDPRNVIKQELPYELAVYRNMGTLIPGEANPSEFSGSWPQFRGADRTNIVRDSLRFAGKWPEKLPVLWEIELGEGHAGTAIHNGCVYIVDYDRELEEDAIRCLSIDDGNEIWRYTYQVRVKRNHGMSRTVPAVNDGFVVTLGPMCHVHCLKAETGDCAWKMDMVKDFGTEVPAWYAGQCPLIDGDRAILAPGADPLMMAVDLVTGETVWKTPNPGGWGMTHSSIVPIEFEGKRQYVYCSTQGVVGVSADTGEILWTKPDWRISISNIPTPIPIGDGRIFLCGGHQAGAIMIRLVREGGSIRAEELFRLKHTVFGSDQQTPILLNNHIYGVAPSGELACIDLFGKLMWTSGRERRFGLGPYIAADGRIFALNDQEGVLRMIEATSAGYKELGAAKVLDGHDAWAPIALAGDRMLLRDSTKMVCLSLPTEEK